jgi:acyl-homoserine lactone acylase PvdQ
MVTELLDEDDSFTLDEAFDLAFSPRVLGAEAWQARLGEAWRAVADDHVDDDADAAEVYEQIAQWNARSDADSVGALSYYYFKLALGVAAQLGDVPDDLSDEALVAAVVAAADQLKTKHGSLTAAYGDLFRVGRQGGLQTYPVGGGSVHEAAMATPRAISFDERDGLRVGRGGQTSTQIVVLCRPPRSYMVLPLGESDHTDSGHWDDQAEKLFGPGLVKDTFFLDRDGLMPEVSRTTTLDYTADK